MISRKVPCIFYEELVRPPFLDIPDFPGLINFLGLYTSDICTRSILNFV